MALEVEYMMAYQYPDLLVTEKIKSADSTVTDRKKAVFFYISLPLLRCSLIRSVLPAPMSFCRTVEPTGTGYRALLHL